MYTEGSNYLTGTMAKKMVYVYKKNYAEDEGFLKIGDASIDRPNVNLEDNSEYLKKIAENRIREYDNSSPITILYSTLAVRNDWSFFRDHQVHEVLVRSGIPKVKKGRSTEWFKTDPLTAIKAINAVKESRSSIFNNIVAEKPNEIIFRPEQEDAINKTVKVLKRKKEMLWNAKMRFGKTLCALEVVKRMKYKKTLILTHRPIVNEGWYEDFNKIFSNYNDADYLFLSKDRGEKIENLLNMKKNQSFIYFASMQDLRGAVHVGGIYDKNEEIFSVDWDLVIIDEAHEGIQTQLGENVLDSLGSKNTRYLMLSGTPFNLLDDYEEDQIYTWDYVMEQEAKANWDNLYPGDSNPYSSLPELKMYVYELGDIIKNNAFVDVENKAFNFAEFFRVDDSGKFIYEKEVWSFLNILSRSEDFSKDKTNMPFSTSEYRNELRHTLWTMPSRASATALENLITEKHHPVFHKYNIANLVDDEEHRISDLEKIKKAITNEPERNYSITLTVRKGTVGVTVKEWTGILVLNNTESASNYLQSIFRVQSPYKGKEGQKEKAYIFDFAPDRTLKMVAEAAKLNIRSGSINSKIQRKQMEKLLNFLPIIGIDGNKMKSYSVSSMLTQLKRAQAEKAVRMGFDDTSIYSDELLKLTDVDLKEFEDLMGIIGKTKQTKSINQIVINEQGMSDEEWEILEKGIRKYQTERTPEEQAAIDKRRKLQKQKRDLVSILRGISIRIPLMIYGMDLEIDDDVTIDNFASKVDDVSWEEFMPKGITKLKFNKFKKYYDPHIFIEAGRRIRRIALSADTLGFEDRIDKITNLFANFRNPDKETVLTPWRVVNMHLGETIGGYNFFDEDYSEKRDDYIDIRYIDKDSITKKAFDKNAKILEINSKTGLYPLYMAYSIYKNRWKNESPNWLKSEWIKRDNKLWEEVLEKNIFVLNKTPMARTITYRTLNGYKENKKVWDNLVYIEELTEKLRNNMTDTISEVYKKLGRDSMKFDVVIGNPPYNESISDEEKNISLSKQLFPDFIHMATLISNRYVCLITPSRWFAGKGQDGSFIRLRDYIKKNNHIKMITHFEDEKKLFNNVDIKGGVSYFLWDKEYSGNVHFIVYTGNEIKKQTRPLFMKNQDVIIPNSENNMIIEKVINNDFIPLTKITTGRNAFGIIGKESVVNKVSSLDRFSGTYELRCKNNEIRWITDDIVNKNREIFNNYKVFISKSAGNPNSDRKVIGYPYLGMQKSACTDSLIPIGSFESKIEAINLQKYLMTKFLRFMVSVVKTSHNVTQIVYKYVPLQDFTNKSDIDWSKPVSDIDQQLYKKYGLSKEEISFIEEKVKEME